MQLDESERKPLNGDPSSTHPAESNGVAMAGPKRAREADEGNTDAMAAREGTALSPTTQRKRQAVASPSPPPVTVSIQDLLGPGPQPRAPQSPLATIAPSLAYMDDADTSTSTGGPLSVPSVASLAPIPLLVDSQQAIPSSSLSSGPSLLDAISGPASSASTQSPPSSPPEIFASQAEVPRIGGWVVPRPKADWEKPLVGEALLELLGGSTSAARESGSEEDEDGISRLRRKDLAAWCNPWLRASMEMEAASQEGDDEDEPLLAFLPQWRSALRAQSGNEQDKAHTSKAAAAAAADSASAPAILPESPALIPSTQPTPPPSGSSSRIMPGSASKSIATEPIAVAEAAPLASSSPAAPVVAPPPAPPSTANGLSSSSSLSLLPKEDVLRRLLSLAEYAPGASARLKDVMLTRVLEGEFGLRPPTTGEEPEVEDALEAVMRLGDTGIVLDDEAKMGEDLVMVATEGNRVDVLGLPRILARRLLDTGKEQNDEKQEDLAPPAPPAIAVTSNDESASSSSVNELSTLRSSLSSLQSAHDAVLSTNSTLTSQLASTQSDLDLIRDLYSSSSSSARSTQLEAETLRGENEKLRLQATEGVRMHAERFRLARVRWEERERELEGRLRLLQGVVTREEEIERRREAARDVAWKRGETERRRREERERREAEELMELRREAAMVAGAIDVAESDGMAEVFAPVETNGPSSPRPALIPAGETAPMLLDVGPDGNDEAPLTTANALDAPALLTTSSSSLPVPSRGADPLDVLTPSDPAPSAAPAEGTLASAFGPSADISQPPTQSS
ncbi:hypothetical protein BDZ90DRAFT_78869 [Jaminaea rosea]|uniref:Uncharacterized protein n=1 Tax=Jaminaea rosea TaxID=1569628 RepID=A0A316UL69_9BASI|nr:hypothetical protein BDZ90DRAFT_78869 [Jaminaea rosea]PWN25131.1 hypothetical protein BDZ90DRAFT_78869 [Jaminaea rosea]